MNLPSFKEHLAEARKNPEQNPKLSVYEQLKPYKDDPSVYISFTEIDKIGINPQSKFNTPLGIYTYNLETGWGLYSVDRLKSLKGFPYASTNPYVNVLRVKKSDGFVEDMYTDYSSSDYDKDERIIESIYFRDIEKVNDYLSTLQLKAVEWVKIYKESLSGAKERNSVMSFWNLSRLTALALSGDREGIRASTKWNSILRECGYTGFGDLSGRGYVHPSEPMQTVFLSTSAFEVLDRIPNKDFKQNANVFSLADLMACKERNMLDMWQVLNIMVGYNTVPYTVGNVTMKVDPETLYDNTDYDDMNALLIEVYRKMMEFKRNPPPIPYENFYKSLKWNIKEIAYKAINSRYFLNGEVKALNAWVDKILDFQE